MPNIVEVTGQLEINLKAREWCKLPYPGHPNGCPNYGKNDTCPPKAPLVDKIFDLSQQHWFIVEEFNLQDHMEKMRTKHSGWSDRQLKCCLYWQRGVRFRLIEHVREFQRTHPLSIYTLVPEAMGVQVINTARKVGIPMETKPQKIVRKIALVGYPIKGAR